MRARPELAAPSLADLARLSDAEFRAFFSRTAIKRIGRDRFVRNVLIALGNVGGDGAVEAAQERLKDASALVRGAAVWALAQLLTTVTFDQLRQKWRMREDDILVIEEWDTLHVSRISAPNES